MGGVRLQNKFKPEIVKLAREGMHPNEIARRFVVRPETVKRVLRQYRVKWVKLDSGPKKGDKYMKEVGT